MLNTKGDVYEGEFTNGQPTGKGKITSEYHPLYEGDVVNGVRTGSGKINFGSYTYPQLNEYNNSVLI